MHFLKFSSLCPANAGLSLLILIPYLKQLLFDGLLQISTSPYNKDLIYLSLSEARTAKRELVKAKIMIFVVSSFHFVKSMREK